MRWHSIRCHAIVFGPSRVFSDGHWTAASEFPSLCGQVHELFFLKHQMIHYAGTYQCHQTQHWFPDGVKLPKDIGRFGLALGRQFCSQYYFSSQSKPSSTLRYLANMIKRRKNRPLADSIAKVPSTSSA